jgi:hypothetical protein
MASCDDIIVYVVRGNTRFGMRLDRNITLRHFTRAIQHNSTFRIPKSNMRLNILQDDGTWTRFYSWRCKSDYDCAIYDMPVSSIGISDGTCLQVQWVMSQSNIAVMVVGGVLAIPAGAVASVAYGGVVSGAFVTGFVVGTLGQKAALQRAFGKARVIFLAPDIPSGVKEIRALESSDIL